MTRTGTAREAAQPPRWGALGALLGATFLGTVSNNIVTVPLHAITNGLGVGVASGVLVVSSFVLVLAVAIPLSGWIGDRFGRRRILIIALGLMTVAMVGAGMSTSLPVLVGWRAVQGLACAAIPPSVMGMLSTIYGAARRARMMSAWAAANSLGLMCGPLLGGLLASLLGWRAIFFVLVPVSFSALLGCLRWVPRHAGQALPLHWPGAVCLMTGATLLIGAATLVGQTTVGWPITVSLAVLGAVFLTAFVVVSARTESPLIAPQLIVEPRFFRSGAAAFTQMFFRGTVVVAVPLYVISLLERDVATAGLVVLVLPAATAAASPVVGTLSDRGSPRWMLRAGLLLLVVAALVLGWYLGEEGTSMLMLLTLLALTGVAIALVQTPAATGATRSPAGQAGAALGLFNMLRFAGTALGAAWVAVVYPHGLLFALFAGCAVLATGTLLISFAGTDPVDTDSELKRTHDVTPT